MNKKQILLDHLAISKTTVSLDSSLSGVKLPSHLMTKKQVSLNLSNKFSFPMIFKDDKVIATLSFNGFPFECHIPYASIFAIRLTDGKIEDAVIFEDDVPKETKEFITTLGDKEIDFLAFMIDLKEQYNRDDITIGSLEGTNKPQ